MGKLKVVYSMLIVVGLLFFLVLIPYVAFIRS